jgi:sensor c-di-GMP phosphodiesterase-like protein
MSKDILQVGPLQGGRTIGKLLGLRVIAEGIENDATAKLLATMGCQEGQGYHFGAPMPAQEFEQRFLRREAKRPARRAKKSKRADAA